MDNKKKSIDIKTLIIYSLVLVVVVVLSYIFIKLPTKKTVETTVEPVVQTTEPEVGSQINKVRSGWQLYKGDTFNINYLSGYTPKVSVSTAGLVTFTSGDINKLIVYYPTTPTSIPSEFLINDQNEDRVSEVTGKNPVCTADLCSREITVVEAKDKSYTKKIMVNKNDADEVTMAFVFQYTSGASDNNVSDIFDYFQQSLVRQIQ